MRYELHTGDAPTVLRTMPVALRMGRAFVGVEINPEYARMAERRLATVNPLFGPARA